MRRVCALSIIAATALRKLGGFEDGSHKLVDVVRIGVSMQLNQAAFAHEHGGMSKDDSDAVFHPIIAGQRFGAF
jgi:hypothetical protein